MTTFEANKSMMYRASASHAEASSFCANSDSANFISLILDAIVASIIICVLLGFVSVLVLVLSLLVLVQLNLLVCNKTEMPKVRMCA